MVVAAFLATALFVGASGAWHLLRGNQTPAVRKMFSMALWMLLIVAPVQAFIGDLHGRNTLEHQPAKLAAIEGHWENEPGQAVPLTVFGWPDMQAEQTRYAIDIPHLGSLILTHSWNGQIPALKDFPAHDRPNATVIFWSFRVMVGLGLLMITLGLLGAWQRWRGRLYQSPGVWRFAVAMGPTGLIAILAGWFTTEIGRQPWVVYNVMRTADAVSPHSAFEVGLALILFVIVYFLVFGVGVAYLLGLVRKGPVPFEPHSSGAGQGTDADTLLQARLAAQPLRAVPAREPGDQHD
jgi:cytochrome d ubiquinol oxidase subunit I